MQEQAIDPKDLVVERDGCFWVHTRAYSDPEIFELEMQKIFHRSWVYVGHESEIPEGGDYKTTFIGRHPVILARSSDDGTVNVFFNRCRHRGATVCQQEYGNANYFRCAYHGWVYNNKGDLMGVPFPEGYGEDFDQGKLGLVKVPRVDSYRGFIFASLSAEGPSLDEHLGNARQYIDQFAALGGEGIDIRGGIYRHTYKGNWKLQLENTVDSYHFGSIHQSIVELLTQHGRNVGSSVNRTGTVDLGNGQGMLDFSGLGYGGGGVSNSAPFNLVLLPNVALLSVQIRVVRPIAVDLTEVSLHFVRPKGLSREAQAALAREHEYFYGPGSFGGPDDIEVAMERVQRGMQAPAVEWRILNRGLAAQTVDEKGIISDKFAVLSEVAERAIYRGWREMLAQS
ncbi:MAG TPA: aromatic ring-hydroxylating dioxygenase subunit alpha [Dehalococcoidia bacterium]|nr:aromatic ring-hydroxylating dioxygenase subunit alpha [Dehalococcoidia bacterium]